MIRAIVFVLCIVMLVSCGQELYENQYYISESGKKMMLGDNLPDLIASQPGIDRGNILTIGAFQIDGRMNPLLYKSSSYMDMSLYIFNGLVRFENGEYVGDLAEYHVSKDYKVYTFNLRDAMFHNGESLTADDVIFTFDLLSDPQYIGPYGFVVSDLENIRKIDDKTVELTFSIGEAERIKELAFPILNKTYYSYDNIMEIEEKLYAPIGTGPFKLSESVEHQHIKLERFDEYYGKKANIEGVILHLMPAGTASDIIMNGGVDFVYLPFDDDYNDLLTNQDVFQYKKIPNGSYDYIGLNQDSPLFSDVRVRKAIAYAIDLDHFSELFTDRVGERVFTSVSPEMLHEPDKLHSYSYDLDKAKELLKDAGWIDSNGDGVLDKDGIEFKFEWLFLQEYRGRNTRQAVEFAAEQLKSIGIEVTLKSDGYSTIVRRVFFDNDYEAYGLYTSFDSLENPRTKFGVDSLNNGVHYYSEDAEMIFDQLDETKDANKRLELMSEWAEISNETLPYIFVSRNSTYVVNSPRVYGFTSPESILYEILDIKLKYLEQP